MSTNRVNKLDKNAAAFILARCNRLFIKLIKMLA